MTLTAIPCRMVEFRRARDAGEEQRRPSCCGGFVGRVDDQDARFRIGSFRKLVETVDIGLEWPQFQLLPSF